MRKAIFLIKIGIVILFVAILLRLAGYHNLNPVPPVGITPGALHRLTDTIFLCAMALGLVEICRAIRFGKEKSPFIGKGESPVNSAVQTSGKAIASLVLGCLSWVLGVFTGVPAIVLGIGALAEIKDESRKLKGKWLAIVGMTLGIVFTLISLLLIIAYALPAWR